MNESKSIFLSKTFWGLVLTALGPLLGKAGVSMTDADAQQAIEAAVTVAGLVLGVWGRVSARKQVSVKGGPLALVILAAGISSGCSAMSAEQTARVRTALQGAQIVASAVAALPVPPGMESTRWAMEKEYWGRYAEGTLKAINGALDQAPFGSAAPCPSPGQPSSAKDGGRE
jgi:uncharacterized membrane protein